MVDRGVGSAALYRRTMKYGITGRKGSGKDTLAKLIVEANPNYKVTHFAGLLKRLSGEIFGLTEAQLHDPVAKESLLDRLIYLDEYVPAMSKATGLNIKPCGKVAEKPRHVLQYFGSDYVRSVDDRYWINELCKEIREEKNVLIPDTRFLNEDDAIREEGGQVIKVVRIDANDSGDLHQSEQEMEQILPGLIVGSRTGDLSLLRSIAFMLAYNDPQVAFYDYKRVQTILGLARQKFSAEEIANHAYAHSLYNFADYECRFRAIANILRYYGNW
jgi:hypothetical protein